MNLHLMKVNDPEVPLETVEQENFLNEYIRLDLEERVVNARARRILAYRYAYPENIHANDSDVLKRANALIRKKTVSERLKYLYDQEGSSVENEFNWTRGKSETVLTEIIFGLGKDGDRLKAIDMLNKMRGFDTPIVASGDETEKDTVAEFFEKRIADA